jgi:RNA polymerase sigma factor (sigma-70 family)
LLSGTTYQETALVTLLKSRDKKAFEQLYDRFSGALYTVICQIVPDRDMANDVLQDVFVNIWRRIESYDATKGRLYTWLLNIARNASIDTVRSKGYQNSLRNRELDTDNETAMAAQTVQQDVDHIGLKKVIGRLKPEQRLMIELAYFQGYTHDEISKACDIPLGTVKTRIRTALIELRQYIKK